MKRLLTAAGIAVGFGVAALTALTLNASSGDVTCVRAMTAPVALTAEQKTLLATAIVATAPTITAADLDEVVCWQRIKSGAALWQCRAHERQQAPSDADYRDIALAGGLTASATAAIRKSHGPRILTDAMQTAWAAVTASVWSTSALGESWRFRFWRSDTGDYSVVSGEHAPITTVSPAQFRADHAAGAVPSTGLCWKVE